MAPKGAFFYIPFFMCGLVVFCSLLFWCTGVLQIFTPRAAYSQALQHTQTTARIRMDKGNITILSQKKAAEAAKKRAVEIDQGQGQPGIASAPSAEAAAAASCNEDYGPTAVVVGHRTVLHRSSSGMHGDKDGACGEGFVMSREALIQEKCQAVAAHDFVPMGSAFSMDSW